MTPPSPSQPQKKSSMLSKRTCSSNCNSDAYFDDKVVSWGNLVLYEFPCILGDNPAVTDGAPLALDWEFSASQEMPIALYEYKRTMRHRRGTQQLSIPPEERKNYLLNRGYLLAEIKNAVAEAKEIRASRDANVAKGRFETIKNVFARQGKFNAQRVTPQFRVAANSA